jgi:hypothetical protein
MFVVRLKRPNEDFDFKAFKSKKSALARFRTAQQEIIDGDVEACALFEADATDADDAMAVVSRGKARLLASNLSDDPPQRSATRVIPAKKRSAAKRKPNNRRSAR